MNIRNNFYMEKFLYSDQALEQAAQVNGGITVSGGIQEMCEGGTKRLG